MNKNLCLSALRRGPATFRAIFHRQPYRTLYSHEELGLTYIRQRRQATFNDKANGNIDERNQYKETIVQQFDEFNLGEKAKELKRFIDLMDLDADDAHNVKTLLQKYQTAYFARSRESFPFHLFGCDVIRTCHILNKPDIALELISDFDYIQSFDQQETYMIFLDLMYENKRYDVVVEQYKRIRTHLLLYERQPAQTLNCLVFAACYHLNTPEHYQYALSLWKQIAHQRQLQRSMFLLSALAVKQNEPAIALNLIDSVKETNFATLTFLRLAIHTRAANFRDVFKMITSILNFDQYGNPKHKQTIGKHLIDDLEAAIRTKGSSEDLEKFEKLKQRLVDRNVISDETLDKKLCAEFPPMLPNSVFRKTKREFKLKKTDQYGRLL